jgi:CHAT domain-containing protein
LEKPLKDKEDGINRLIIIPNEELLYISFDNLLTAPNSDAFLIRDYAISYAYSNQLLNRTKEQKNRQKPLEKFIGFGIEYDSLTINSVFRQQSDLTRSLSKLEYAVEEVQAIASILGGQTLINQFATKEAFFEYAPNTSILHLAMHGIIDEQVLNEASLVFTKSPESEEHLLRSSDLYAMELNNNLAVLSACNTANGSIQKGEGIRSLARAFSYAGCSSLVASLWLAPDLSSKDILVQFYENLEDGMPKDVALQKAKLSYLDSGQPNIYKAPIFWSHLMVFGDTNPIKRSSNWMYWIIGIAAILFIFYFIRKK